MLSLAILAANVMEAYSQVPDRTIAGLRDKWERAAAIKIQAVYRGWRVRIFTTKRFPCGSYIEYKNNEFHGDMVYCCGTTEAWWGGHYMDTLVNCSVAGCVVCDDSELCDNDPVCPCGRH